MSTRRQFSTNSARGNIRRSQQSSPLVMSYPLESVNVLRMFYDNMAIRFWYFVFTGEHFDQTLVQEERSGCRLNMYNYVCWTDWHCDPHIVGSTPAMFIYDVYVWLDQTHFRGASPFPFHIPFLRHWWISFILSVSSKRILCCKCSLISA